MTFVFQYGAPIPDRYSGKYLFVISHMRSFSSLLCHILGSHAEIAGYSELHQSYVLRADLERLARKVTGEGGMTAGVPRTYVLDKILHNYLEISPTILTRADVKCVFLLRNGDDTILSSLEVMHLLGKPERFGTHEVLEYYVGRLAQMRQYSTLLGGNAFFIESERLIDEADAVLGALSSWLSLDGDLSTAYRTFPLTGIPGHGDPSHNIKAGKLVADATERHRDYVPITVPDDVKVRSRAAHAECRAALLRNVTAP